MGKKMTDNRLVDLAYKVSVLMGLVMPKNYSTVPISGPLAGIALHQASATACLKRPLKSVAQAASCLGISRYLFMKILTKLAEGGLEGLLSAKWGQGKELDHLALSDE